MSIIVITGTGTGVGKTVVTAAIATLASQGDRRVAVLKPAQTGVRPGEPGDLDDIRRLVGEITTRELRRYPDPLSPEAAARRSGISSVTIAEITAEASVLADRHDLVLIEGAGGLLVRFGPSGHSIADLAASLATSVIVVTEAGLGTLNATALTTEVAAKRGLAVTGIIIGSWPAHPDVAAVSNVDDLPVAAGVPLLGAIPENSGKLSSREFAAMSYRSLVPALGGAFNVETFRGIG